MTMLLKFDHNWLSEVLRNVISDLVTSGEEARIILLVLLRNHSLGKSSYQIVSSLGINHCLIMSRARILSAISLHLDQAHV